MFYYENHIGNPAGLYDTTGCVRLDLTMDCEFSAGTIWTDENSRACNDVSVWGVITPEGALDTDFLYAHNAHETPPSLTPKCIKSDAVLPLRYDAETGKHLTEDGARA